MRRLVRLGLGAALALLAGCAPRAGSSLSHAGVAAAFVRLPARPSLAFSFVVLGDYQFMDDTSFERVVRDARRVAPDLAFQVGDLVLVTDRDAPAEIARQWRGFWARARGLGAPFFPVPGNHDVAGPRTAAAWEKAWGALYYSFDHGGCHFVVLDSEAGSASAWAAWSPHPYAFDFGKLRVFDPWPRPGRTAATAFGPEQSAWLARDLASTRARHVFVFLHRPLWQDRESRHEWERYHELFRRSRVRCVFAGHVHRFTRERRDGIEYITTLAAREGPGHLESGRFAHLVRVDVSAEAVRPRLVWRGRTLPLEAVDPAVQEAHRLRWAKLPKAKLPGRPGVYAVQLVNPTSGPVAIRYAWEEGARCPFRFTPGSGRTELAPGAERKLRFFAEPRAAPLPEAPRLRLDVQMRSASVRRWFPVPLELNFSAVPLRDGLPGRVVLVGKGKGRSIAWLLDRYGLQRGRDYLEAASPRALDALWPTLRPGDALVTAHLAFTEEPGLARWYWANRAKVRRFLESGGRLVACLGHREEGRPLLADYGVRYRRHDRAWKTDRKGDNELLVLARPLETNPLARGLLGGRLRYTRVAMLDGSYALDSPRAFAVLATDSTGEPAVVARRVGAGLLVLSSARLNSHHHMADHYNQGRIWPNLLTLRARAVDRLAGGR